MRFFVHRAAVLAAALATVAFLPLPAHAAPAPDDGPAVYLKLVQAAPLPFDQVAQKLEATLETRGWNVAARMDCGVEASACSFRSRVIVAYTDAYADRVMRYGTHAAFAVPIRFVVWEDEGGVHVGATNPMNLNRTIVDEGTAPSDWADVATEIRAVTAEAFPGATVTTEYGQRRENARIGRTMGIMAGGKFVDKIEHVLDFTAAIEPSRMADALVGGMGSVPGDWDWGITPVYQIDLPEHGVSIVGVTGKRMEADAFGIVRHGGDDAREDMACPGIDHAAAFPIEIVISREGGNVRVSLVDEMYRMKMFFENAGKVAFAKNMAMPGSIESEIKKKIEAVF